MNNSCDGDTSIEKYFLGFLFNALFEGLRNNDALSIGLLVCVGGSCGCMVGVVFNLTSVFTRHTGHTIVPTTHL